jgi:hypothetical protein
MFQASSIVDVKVTTRASKMFFPFRVVCGLHLGPAWR